MTLKQMIGAALVTMPFAMMAAVIYSQSGFRGVIIVFGAVTILVVTLAGGIVLLTENSDREDRATGSDR